jgi:GNAT superfamily N-acetyltransferase
MTLVQPYLREQWTEARRLVEEYVSSLNLELEFQDFGHEIQSLAHEYGPPNNYFLLAEQDGAFVGCGGLRRISDTACEMKRLYVCANHRGAGVGRAIAEALIEQARQLGYQTMLLDTLPSMNKAQDLYKILGFRPTTAYRYNPLPGASFWRLEL